jgi:16S rRNA (cytidine1402-2'-O)-methyltransferase
VSAGRLTVIATPIGNLGDLSPRGAEALRQADLVACEDTRRTATLLRAAGSTAPMVPAHEHNEAARAEDLVRRMRTGARVALVTDAGMPGVSDPGGRIVRAAALAGVEVEVVPGPSAVETALAASGFPADGGFLFVGFPPRKAAERALLLDEIVGSLRPVVLFESPKRLPALLADLAARDPSRGVAVCRELTKMHEQVLRGPAAEIAGRVATPPKGEVTVVVHGSTEAGGSERDLAGMTELLLDAGLSASQTAGALAALGLARRNAAYQVALEAASRRPR